MITYEYPLNERIRTLLRLEDLFDKFNYFLLSDGAREHHGALLTIFEILEAAGRADLKMDLIQELERQRQALLAFRNNPEISEAALSGALYEIEQASAALLSMTGKIGQYLRENEWLMAIKSRAVIPGGACEFDLPSYHYWLHQQASARRDALMGWLRPLIPLQDGIIIVLRLLRASGSAESHVAAKGNFQKMLGGTSSQMVKITLTREVPFVPEISANKYALNVRFVSVENDSRHRNTVKPPDIAFDMTLCNL